MYMREKFNLEERINIRDNLQYLIKQIETSFKPTKFEWGNFGIELSQETFYSAYYADKKGRNPTYKTVNIIARALSSYIQDDRVLEVDDFTICNDKFIQLYSSKIIRNQINSSIKFDLFENRLFRCYYLVPGSNKQAMIGYFKIFNLNDGSISAFLLRGISYFDDRGNISNKNSDIRSDALKRMIRGFVSPKNIKNEFAYYKENNRNKEDERIQLYSADKENIHISKSCIRIDFEVVDDSLDYKSTMFWNIEPITKTIGIETLIGGLALIVDTNDGDRQMCTYKMGLDAVGTDIDKINGEPFFIDKPLYCESPTILNELSISSDKRVYVLDRVEDTLWYHYVQDDSKREVTSKMYTEEEFHEVVASFNQMKRDYDKQLFELKSLVNKLLRLPIP